MFRLTRLAAATPAVAAAASLLSSKEKEEQVPEHMRWDVTDEGLIQARTMPDLRLNVAGGNMTGGSEIVLWPCQVQSHEQFDLVGTQIKLHANPNLCLNIEGGLGLGHRVVSYHCGSGEDLSPNEEFVFEDGLVKMKHEPDLCLNVKEGMLKEGGEIILWNCDGQNDNELFELDGLRISMKNHPTLHLNVAGGGTEEVEQPVVIWTCHGGSHELFEFQDDGRIHAKNQPALCLNAAGGVQASHQIVLWPCHETPEPNELWTYSKQSGAISASSDPKIGFNVAGGSFQPGDKVVLWQFKDRAEL